MRVFRRKGSVLVGLGACLTITLLTLSVATGARVNEDDPRNFSFGLTYKGNPTQDCWKHHKSEGMYDSHIVIPIFPKQIKLGEPAELQIQIENAWKYDLSAIQVQLNLTGDETFIVPLVGSAAEQTPPLKQKWQGILQSKGVPRTPGATDTAPPSKATHNFTVEKGAIALIAHLDLYYPEGTSAEAFPNSVSAEFFPPGTSTARRWSRQLGDEATTRDLILPRGTGIDLEGIPDGEWKFVFEFDSGPSTRVAYASNVTVLYQAVGANTHNVFTQLRNPANPDVKPAAIVTPRGVSDVITIPILGVKEGTQKLEVVVQALLYYKHQAGGTPNEDTFERVATQEIIVGQEFIASETDLATGGTVEVDFYMMAGEVTGFAAAFLLLPSLLLGGTYGRTSRKLLNDMLGGAKRRVMFHNLASLGLTFVALVHIVLFLLEVRYTVMMGVLWGGLGALSLLVLGLTGYYQVPLIQKYGYNWWRVLHLATGLLVVVFTLGHTIQDGPDFFFLKEQMPQWAQDFNWARMEDLK